MKADYFDWNERVVAKLRALWADGMPVRQIGAELGCNASQVIGKAHRLDLPRRQNPVKRTYEKRPAVPPKNNSAPYTVGVAEVVDARVLEVVPIATERFARVRIADRLPVPVGALPPSRTCQWTDSARWPWVFCGCATVPGYSWCAGHKARVFERRAA